jgi:hypothetical protein
MRSASPFYAFALFALLATSPALAEDKAAPAAEAAPVAAPAAKEVEMLHRPLCAIEGVVTALQKIEKSAWADGAPSNFSTVEVQISLRVATRTPYRANDKDAIEFCKTTQGGTEVRSYKLCSPTPVKAGDYVTATEGNDTGTASVASCLFDLSVKPAGSLPKKEMQ